MFGKRAAELAGIATALLGWRPDEFWRSTPEELAMALGAGGGAEGEIDRRSLERLKALFPDKRET